MNKLSRDKSQLITANHLYRHLESKNPFNISLGLVQVKGVIVQGVPKDMTQTKWTDC